MIVVKWPGKCADQKCRTYSEVDISKNRIFIYLNSNIECRGLFSCCLKMSVLIDGIFPYRYLLEWKGNGYIIANPNIIFVCLCLKSRKRKVLRITPPKLVSVNNLLLNFEIVDLLKAEIC